MTAPVYPPLASLTVERMKLVMGAPAMTPADEAWLVDSVNEVAAYAGRMVVMNKLGPEVLRTAEQHCMRVYNRRGSSTGLQQFDMGAAAYVGDIAKDSDLALGYRLGYPRVG